MKFHAALLIAGLALTPLGVVAQTDTTLPAVDPPDSPPTFSRTASNADVSFVTSLLAQARTQIALAGLAQGSTHGAATQAIAAREIAKWTPMRDRLVEIAAVQGLPTPDVLDAPGQGAYDRLNALSTGPFASSYASLVAASDRRAQRAMFNERTSSNPALISFVNDHINGFGSAGPQHP
jgi:hypothetical protein